MGNKQSQPDPAGGGSLQEARVNSALWGTAPDEVPADEQDPEELILQSWAFCKAKPSPTQTYRSDTEERKRRQQVAWRKRSSFIELDCGEDSFFVSNNYKVIGVADGVGGWRDEGVDPSYFANSLMENAKHFSETHRRTLDPEDILTNAYAKVLHDGKVKAGSSTACLAALRSEAGKTILDVANLGDSGLLVVRNRQQLHRIHEKVHGFNAPFQLAVLPRHLRNRAFSDHPHDCTRESIEVQKGDVIVMGTDGLFDNRFNATLAEEAGWIGEAEASVVERIPLVGFFLGAMLSDQKVAYADPYRVAQRIVQNAYKASVDKDAHTPWASMLRKFGASDAKGGKTDDITVLLARVGTRGELRENTTTW